MRKSSQTSKVMPKSSSTSHAEVRRRDRNKVYAVADLQDEDRSDSSAPLTITKDCVKVQGSSRAAALSRGEKERCDSKAASTGGRVGVRVDDRNSSHEASGAAAAAGGAGAAPANIGSVGPGAEPPVAVASHAFAHEQSHTETLLSDGSNSGKQGKDGAGPPFPDDEGVGAISSEEDVVGIRKKVGRGGGTRPSWKYHSEKDNTASSRPGSTNTNNEDEAETLPDSFNLSDEYGLEGASTGRNHHDDGDDCDGKAKEPVFFGLDVESASSGNREKRGRGQKGRFAAGRGSGTHPADNESSSEHEPRQEKRGGGVHASENDSGGWPSSSEQQMDHEKSPHPQPWFGRRTRQNYRRPLTSTKRTSRILPFEDAGEWRARDNEGMRRYRGGRSRNGAQYRSPPPRRHPRRVEDDTHRRRGRRGVSRPKSRDRRRLAQTETESMSEGGTSRFDAEMARLRRENKALKTQQERPTRSNGGRFKAEQDSNGDFASRKSPRRSSRRYSPSISNERHHQRIARRNDAPNSQERRRDRSPARSSSPVHPEIPSARSSSRRRRDDSAPRSVSATSWSDFVSRSRPSPQSVRPTAWEGAPLESQAGGVDIGLPRILVEGGFLWKLPYHNAGTPKRRWFQIKPAEGLLTTSCGRLVVRPTVAGGDGGWAVRDGCNANSEGDDDGASSKDPTTPMPMMRLRAAWPLAFIWVDPGKDLKRSPPREMLFEEIVDLARGHKTPAFWQQAAHRGIHALPDPKLCFSLVGHDRTLDLAAETLAEAKEWVRALARVALMIKRGGTATTIGDRSVSCSRPQLEPGGYSDPGEVRTDETAEDDADTLCSDAAHLQRPGGPAAAAASLNKEAAARIPENSPLLGEGGNWSVDTIRAWRRRIFPAVMRGDLSAVLALFDQGCPVDLVQTGTGDTPMLLACRLGDIEMTRECLRRGSRNDPHPEFGQTALHAAVARGKETCARLLLETAAPSRSDAVISNHKDPNKETPLHVACRGGFSGIVDALLHHGADMRAVDKRGNTPLHGAAGAGHADALASLLDAGGDGMLEERNARGERALHTAAAAGHIACVELLLGTAAEPDVPNEDGQTPFALASRGGHLAVTRLIRQYAPAAGTPSGGDAQFQALQLRSVMGESATADALPRPHASGSASSGPGTPDRRSRDLEHRCYSAAGLDQRQFDAGGREPFLGRRPTHEGDDNAVKRTFLRGGGGKRTSGICGPDGESHGPSVPRPADNDEQALRSPPLSSSAPVHGSLFDGLQVYVVGGRQPLGSQHASGTAAAAAGRLSARSAHNATTARTIVLDSHRLSMSSRRYQYQDHQRGASEEQLGNRYLSSQRASLVSASTASFSSGALEPNWRDNVLSAPSTVAPSPPLVAPCSNAGMSEVGSTALPPAAGLVGTPRADGGDTSRVGVPGSARALARMMHFSGGNNRAAPSCAGSVDPKGLGSTTRGGAGPAHPAAASRDGSVAVQMAEASAGSVSIAPSDVGGGDDDVGMPTEAIGSWMASDDHGQDKSLTCSAGGAPELGPCGDEDDTEPTPASRSSTVAVAAFSDGAESPATPGVWVSDIGTARLDGIAEERAGKAELSFVIDPPEGRDGRPNLAGASAPLPGVWRVFESQGYPYYLHEASGHSQWEDPRENEKLRSQELLSTMAATDVSRGVRGQDSDQCSEGSNGAAREEKGVETAAMAVGKTAKEVVDRGCPTRASPIKPTGVPVAVQVSRYVESAVISPSAKRVPLCYGEEASKTGKHAEQDNGSGEFFDTTLEGNPGRASVSTDSCGGSADSRDFDSIDTASFQGGNGGGSEDGASLPLILEVEAPATMDDEMSKGESMGSCSDDGCRHDVGANTASMTADATPSDGTRIESETGDTTEESRGQPRQEVLPHDEPSIPVDGTTDISVESSAFETMNGYDEKLQEQEEDEEEEEWWQEIDDETNGDTQL